MLVVSLNPCRVTARTGVIEQVSHGRNQERSFGNGATLQRAVLTPRAFHGRIETSFKVAAGRCYQLGTANVSVGASLCDACRNDSLPSAGDFRMTVISTACPCRLNPTGIFLSVGIDPPIFQ